MTVVDASVLIPALTDDAPHGRLCRKRIASEELWAPELVDLEVVSACRGLLRAGRVDARRCHDALLDLASMALSRVTHTPLLERIWELRDNLTAYDAAYVALAEAHRTTLLTADERLAIAPGVSCAVELLTDAE